MEEKWELCTFESDQKLVIFSPDVPPKIMSWLDYMESKGDNHKLSIGYGYRYVYPYLLADGWEPFGVLGNNQIAFRRKVSL